MIIDEGGLPKGGSLSDYVTGKLRDITSQKAEVERQSMEMYLQRTALLRDHLIFLAAPIEELFGRFRVRELLVEASHQVGGHFRGSPEYLSPKIYQELVSKTDHKKELFDLGETGESRLVPLDVLIDPNNFQKLIPRLIGFGFRLVAAGNYPYIMQAKESFVYFKEHVIPGYVSYDINGVKESSPTTFYKTLERKRLERKRPCGVTHRMTIMGIGLPAQKDTPIAELALEYTVDRQILESDDGWRTSTIINDELVELEKRPLLNKLLVDRIVRIKADQSTDDLKRLIGDDLVSWQVEWNESRR